jgi:Mg2+/Co2+ transporter CorB
MYAHKLSILAGGFVPVAAVSYATNSGFAVAGAVVAVVTVIFGGLALQRLRPARRRH